ncbi:MAG TPA: hypothetical protein VG186_12290 [Solirubrobacteraceae bacterium]|jgi:hypothetical protein|nr:hypothetical protein [Solirubrobacteraceae bacterium]
MTDEAIEEEGGEELVDGLPVLAEVHPIERPAGVQGLPAVQAAAAVVTGFVAGAATLAVMRRRQARRLARRPPGLPLDYVPAGGTRTFLVHVQRLGRLEE